MSTNSTEDRTAIDRLTEAMVDDVLNTPHERLLAEVAEDYGNSRAFADEFDNVVARARRKLAWVKFKLAISRLVEVCGLGLVANSVLPIAELQSARSRDWSWNSRPVWAGMAAVLVVIIAAPIIYFSYEHYIDAQRSMLSAKAKADREAAALAFGPGSEKLTYAPVSGGMGLQQFTIARFDNDIQLYPTNANSYYVRGLYYAETAKYDAAIRDLSKAIQLDPKNAVVFSSRGVTYSMELNWDRALKDFNEAVRLDPKYVMWDAGRGEKITATPDENRALADFSEQTQLLKIAMALANHDRSISSANMDYTRAVSLFEEALRLQSKFGDIYRSRGRAYFFAKDYDAAAADFEHLLQRRPDDAYAVLWLYLTRTRATKVPSTNSKASPDCPQDLMSGGRSVNGNVVTTYCNRDALTELEANTIKLKQADWPYPIVEAYLGRRSPEATIGAATNAVERCEAQFYVGEWRLLSGNRTAAADTLKTAAELCPKNLIEFAMIQTELKSLIGSPPSSKSGLEGQCVAALGPNLEPMPCPNPSSPLAPSSVNPKTQDKP